MSIYQFSKKAKTIIVIIFILAIILLGIAIITDNNKELSINAIADKENAKTGVIQNVYYDLNGVQSIYKYNKLNEVIIYTVGDATKLKEYFDNSAYFILLDSKGQDCDFEEVTLDVRENYDNYITINDVQNIENVKFLIIGGLNKSKSGTSRIVFELIDIITGD